MLARGRGFSLAEALIAIAISSILLLGSARFLPALQRGALQQARSQILEEEIWQRVFALSRHLQRAGYCASRRCAGEPLTLSAGCALIRWDTRLAPAGEDKAATNDDVTGFRLREGALETLRGAASCDGKGWEKMTDPAAVRVTRFELVRTSEEGMMPEIAITLAASDALRGGHVVQARLNVTGYNL